MASAVASSDGGQYQHIGADPMSHGASSSSGLGASLRIWASQLWSLSVKCALVLWRSKKALATFLLAPLILVALMWIIQARIDSSNSSQHGGVDVPLKYQRCQTMDIYNNPDPGVPCVSIYFSPTNDTEKVSIMHNLANRLGFTYGVDIVGVSDASALTVVLARQVGRYDAAITFDSLAPVNQNAPADSVTVAPPVAAQPTMGSPQAIPSCPITTALEVDYVLWLNGTRNANDAAPSWITQRQNYADKQTSYPVPPRYWALQQALNMAITDFISASGVPQASEADAIATEASSTAAPASSSIVHLAFWDMMKGRTGTSTWSDDGGGWSLNAYNNDSVTKWAGSSIITIGVLVITLLGIQLVAAEKQGRIIGLLRIMGLKESAYWASWLFVFAALAFVASILAAAMGKISSLHVYTYCDYSIHLVALFLYLTCMLSMSLLFSSCIQRALLLNIVSFILFFTAVLCGVFFGSIFANSLYRPDMPNVLKILFFIFPWFHYSKIWCDILQNTSLVTMAAPGGGGADGRNTVSRQFSYHWSQITQTQRIYASCQYGDEECCNENAGVVNCFDAPSTSSAMGNLVILTIVYVFLAYYFAQVFGASLGMNRRAWFLFTPSFWGFQSDDDRKLAELQAMNSGAGLGAAAGGAGGQDGLAKKFLSQDRLVNEQFLSLKNSELRTYKLSKSYAKTSALKECTLKMHAGEVFVLLGHNGAGKSTLVNCLTGLLAPTFGSAFIFGHSLSNIHRLQSEMGVCMQDDLLFDNLTTRETLRVFAAMRGIIHAHIESTVESKLVQFHMQSYADKPVHALSGGMKRRLSLSLATLGSPKVIFLDEPTTGMDPINRNRIWETIRSIKAGKIIVLTTHNMEEADYLGDTISLMSNGRMRAMGSALFLKNRYGAGYQLQLLINPAFHTQISGIVKRLLPGCEIVSQASTVGSATADTVALDHAAQGAQQDQQQAQGQTSTGHGNLTIGLKRKSLRALPAFFQWLEQEEARYVEAQKNSGAAADSQSNSDSAKVLREWSLSNSTLEEVFLRLCAVEKNVNERVGGQSAEADDEAEAELAAADAARFGREVEELGQQKCMLCRTRPSLELVTLYSKAGLGVDFAHLLCATCSHAPEAIKLLGGSSAASSTVASPEGAASAPHEDDAPIVLSTADVTGVDVSGIRLHPVAASAFPSTTAPQQSGAYQLQVPAHAQLQQPSPFAPVMSGPQKGENRDLDVANTEESFHLAWDSLGHAPPSSFAQIRAVYLKNAHLLAKEKKSSCCKLIVLLLLTFIVLLQTSGTPKMCPQGWITPPGDPDNWRDQMQSLPCYVDQVATMFNDRYQRPVVPLSTTSQSPYTNSAPVWDVYDCTNTMDVRRCGWLPAWPVNPSVNMGYFSLLTSDVLADEGAGGVAPSQEDAPLSAWSVQAPQWTYWMNPWNIQFSISSQTDNIVHSRERVLMAQPGGNPGSPPQPPQPPYPPKSGAPTPLRAGTKEDRSPPSTVVRGVPVTAALGSVSDERFTSLEDVFWATQQWVDRNASALPDACSMNPRVPFGIFLHFEEYTSYAQEAQQLYMSNVWSSGGIELLQSKPYPMVNGVRVPETSASDFTPTLEYRMRVFDQDHLPQAFFATYDDNKGYCANTPPMGMGSSDIPLLIHAMSNSFLLTRLQSLWSDRLDIGRNVTFTSYLPIPETATNLCPAPLIRASVVQFPSVNFSPGLSDSSIYLSLGFLVFISLLQWPNSVAHILYERESKLMHMMRISGMRDLSFWIAQYLWDMTTHFVWFALLLGFGIAYGSPVFVNPSIFVFGFVCLCFVHYSIGLAWIVAALFSKKRIGLVVSYLVVVLAAFLAIILDTFLPSTWPLVYIYIPPLAYVRSLSAIIRYAPQNLSDDHGAQLLTAVLIMIFEGFVMIAIGMYLNICMYRGAGWAIPAVCRRNAGDAASTRPRSKTQAVEMDDSFNATSSAALLSAQEQDDAQPEDIDCAAERAKVNALARRSPEDYPAILLHNLRKEFGADTRAGKTKVAVNELCMAVEYGECFGLLGPNGAGKSTTLSILTGLLSPTSGRAHLCGFDIERELDSVFSILGICPQFDVIWDDLTVQEHLLFYARLKGVASSWESGLVQYIAELCDLDGDPLRKPAASLSGGMKRRLSLGISLIGNPKIWLLDEPSTGLSPETRREIWAIIERRKRRSRAVPGTGHSAHGKAIVITTHSMEEADTLCSRIAILADGRLQCLGSAAHLKARFGEGFKLTLHLQHEFERAAVDELLRSEAAGGAASQRAEAAAPSAHVSIRFHSAAHESIVRQHVALMRFVLQMAPHAKLAHVAGKQIIFRLHPDDKAAHAGAAASSSSSSSSSSSAAAAESSKTAEVLNIFNQMELHRSRLLPDLGVAEWGLSQSSLEEVFLAICGKFESDDTVVDETTKKKN